MVALYIIGGVVLLIGILMFLPIRVNIVYKDDFYVKVKYLFVTLYNSKSKNKNKKKKKKAKNKDKNKKTFVQKLIGKVKEDSGADAIESDVKKGNKFGFDFELIKLMYDAAKGPVKRFIRKIRVENFSLDCVIGGDDAALIALNYGLQSAVISGMMSWLNETVTLKVKKVSLTADFTKEETDLTMKCRVKIRIISAAVFLMGYIVNTTKNIK